MTDKKLNILRTLFICTLVVAVLIIISFESEWLPVGEQAYDSTKTYTLELSGIALTLIAIPLSLRLMHFSAIKKRLQDNKESYFSLSLLRISLLSVALLYDVLTYYLLGLDATLGYLALMTAVALLFAWPSRGKMEYECGTDSRQDGI